MLGKNVKDIAQRMIQVENEKRRKQIQTEIERIKGKMASQGILQSSITIQMIFEACSHEIEVRAQIIWQTLHRVITTSGVQPTDILATDLKAEVKANLPTGDLRQHLTEVNRFHRVPNLPTLDEAHFNALKKIDAEIDLFVLSLSSRAASERTGSSQTAFHIYSPVGAIQTGPNATATFIQNINLQDKEVLLQALDLLKTSIQSVEEFSSSLKEETLELVEESRLEVQKTKPNGMRLRSILTSIGTTIQTVNSLRQIYDSLKTALVPYGILLP